MELFQKIAGGQRIFQNWKDCFREIAKSGKKRSGLASPEFGSVLSRLHSGPRWVSLAWVAPRSPWRPSRPQRVTFSSSHVSPLWNFAESVILRQPSVGFMIFCSDASEESDKKEPYHPPDFREIL